LNTAEPGVQTVTVTLNDTHLYPSVTTSFYILIADGNDFLTQEVISNNGVYGTLSEVIKAAETSGIQSVVYVVADVITAADPLTISNGNIILTVLDGNATIRRGSENGSLFTIESGGSLTLNAGDSLELTLDGCKLSADAPLVKVSGGELIMGRGVTLQNNHNDRTSNTGGGVYVSSGGMFTMTGGKISGNRAQHGGGVYISNNSLNKFEMSGGKISGNEAADSGHAYGGGVYVGGGTFTMDNGATISGNTVSGSPIYGGGVFVSSSGTLTMNGGVISGNTAGSNGNGVYVSSSAENAGTFTMEGSSTVDQVYLRANTKIVVSGPLDPPGGVSAQIKLANDANGTVVLVGKDYTLKDEDVTKFKLLDSSKGFLYNAGDNNAKLEDGTSGSIQASYSSGGTPIYGDLKTIISNVTGTENAPAVITVANNVTLDSPVDIVSKHIKLTVLGNVAKIIKRGSANGSLFTVTGTDASLTLDAGNGSLTLDGDKSSGITADAPLVTVSRGTLTMGNGVTLQNNNKTSGDSGGAIDVQSGTFYMTGGVIRDNTSTDSKGGGVKLAKAEGSNMPISVFYMSGGTISGNTTGNGNNGGGVYIDHNSEFYMSGNTANWGGGVYMYSGKFEMSGGVIYGKNENDTSLQNHASADSRGHAVYNYEGTGENTSDYTIDKRSP
jgi:hypothetical protein